MEVSRVVTVLSVAVVLGTLVVTGPLVGGQDGARATAELGEGTATVEDVGLTGSLSMTPGRFGTGVVYLRIPDAAVDFSAVTGRSRLVYRVAVPALDFDRVGTAPFGTGTTRRQVGMSDRAFSPERVNSTRYRVAVTVRVQSFAVDRTVFRRNVTVEAPDG
jgi:hypothetical protein